MRPTCSHCGESLDQFRLFSQNCADCGSKHVARPSFSWIRGLLGGVVAPVLWFASFYLPIPTTMKLLGVPILMLLIAFWISLANQRWVHQPGRERRS